MENLDLAERLLAHVTEHPEEFDMRRWGYRHACRTTACLAGHAMLLSGYTMTYTGLGEAAFRRPNGETVHIEETEGRQLLGLTDDEFYVEAEGDSIFYLADAAALDWLRRIVEDERDRRAAAPRETDLPPQA